MVMQRIFPAIIAQNQKEFNTKIIKIRNISRIIHLDFMDGKFVKNKSLGLDLKLKKGFYYHAHLMVNNPKRYVERYKGRIGLFLNQWESIKNKKGYLFMKRNKIALIGGGQIGGNLALLAAQKELGDMSYSISPRQRE